MKDSFKIKMEYPESNILDRKCKWVCPEFEAVDGICEESLWTFSGLIVAIGFIDKERKGIIGSGIMIAPGLCLTATHVMEEIKKKQALLFTFPNEDNMRIWIPKDFNAQQKTSIELIPFQKPEPKYSDVGVLSYSPFSKFKDAEDYLFAPIAVSVPKIGERLWATGYRQISNNGVPKIAFFIISGLVTEQYLEGRGSHINGPCVEVAMEALGGMSGGPVFNANGSVIGVISSSLEGADDSRGPTYVSLAWTSLLSTVYSPWPENHWSENIAGIQAPANGEGARLLGSARVNDDGAILVKFPSQDYYFSDFAYENLEDYLEEEGLQYLSTVDKKTFDMSLIEKDYTEIIKLFKCFDAYTMEGLEDLIIQSVILLEDGNIGIDALFDIRIVFLRLQISRDDHDYHQQSISSLTSLHNQEFYEDSIYYDHYVRPLYRVNFTYNIQSEECQDIRFHSLSMKI